MEIKGNSEEAFTFRILLLSALLYLFTAMEMYIIETVFVKVPYYYCKFMNLIPCVG
jgi:hypothetical protein